MKMNLSTAGGNDATRTFNRSKNVVNCSGLCSRCLDSCRGNCEVFKSSFRGREVIYPGPFGEVTAGGDKEYPVDYSHLNIQGYAQGANGLPKGITGNSDTAIFPAVDTGTEYGWTQKVKMRVPIFTGALGSTEIARKNWEHFAVGAAISGITIVCGENVCGIDPQLELDSRGKIVKAPDMDRRIQLYKRFYDGYGEILVQMNVEDTRLGVAEYMRKKHNMETIELKWGQGAKCIGGEIKVKTLERAIQLKKRGYIVTPDPELPAIQQAFKAGAIKEFERHSRLGFVSEEGFMKEIKRLRDLGYKRITLKTGAYSMVELAQALKFCSAAKIDLLTIDGASGGTGMSPWKMMQEWGIPTFYLQSLAYEFCEKMSKKKMRVPDIAIAGGFALEDHVFKVLAMGAPYVKAVCMGRALMIPGFVGKNIQEWIKNGNVPPTVSEFGANPEAIFVCYEELAEKYGKDMKDIPLGDVGIYTFSQRIKVGLQQLMAGSRNFSLSSISRKDLMTLSEEAEKISGIPYVMDAYRKEAEKVLFGK
jgi:glutamate synthase domain-containing protein 2